MFPTIPVFYFWNDAKRVAVQGHSRYGKAAIVAMAYDQRISTGYISSSGAGGAKLHRRDFGEIIEIVCSTSEYHWMAGNRNFFGGWGNRFSSTFWWPYGRS